MKTKTLLSSLLLIALAPVAAHSADPTYSCMAKIPGGKIYLKVRVLEENTLVATLTAMSPVFGQKTRIFEGKSNEGDVDSVIGAWEDGLDLTFVNQAEAELGSEKLIFNIDKKGSKLVGSLSVETRAGASIVSASGMACSK